MPERKPAQIPGTPATKPGAMPAELRPRALDGRPRAVDGRSRAVIDAVRPCVDGGRFAIKRIEGDHVRIDADCFTDGHDMLRVMLRWRAADASHWQEIEMQPFGNDRWYATLVAGEPGRYVYSVVAWVDAFLSWRHDFERREDAEDVAIAARVGAALIEAAAARATGKDRRQLAAWAERLMGVKPPADTQPGTQAGEATAATAAATGAGSPAMAATGWRALREIGLNADCAAIAARYPDRTLATTWPVELPMVVDRERARYSTWYEMFPRSASPEPGRHGTFADLEAQLDYVSQLGFDVLYLPPIHPIGREKRKGRNNALAAEPGDVGSPWAIGAAEGGHKSLHPALGTMEDFDRLVERAAGRGIEIALDIAYQCAPDHPYVKTHPQWFRLRPDGTVQYAENPPKKYQDIYPFNFETDDWRALWDELKSVLDFWVGHGVKIFRVDNPHTKSFAFWEWAIGEVKRAHPEVLFLAEAFTRPKVMHRLAKLGFTQSYTYFAWRNTKPELTEYFTELAHGPGREYFGPNVWPNTPDILPEPLQIGGRPVFMARLVLAATLAASYGIYGPAYELMEAAPREPGSEEYLDSEKYQLRTWELDRPDSLRLFIALVNRIRLENPALHSNHSLRFFPTDNDRIICYAKQTPDGTNQVVTVVSLDPHNAQSAWVELDLEHLGLADDAQYQMQDLLTGARFLWQGTRNFVRIDPARVPAHVFSVRRKVRQEQDFDYFL